MTRERARVIATDVTETPGCRRLDVTSEKDWAELAAELGEAYGQVHGLVSNAGITWRARIDDISPEDMAGSTRLTSPGDLPSLGELGSRVQRLPPGADVG
ncbi:SDR family oxidoreductase [Streptomyces misionensis]|uniref:SDR family oxidoreductase n=1 Tax=Streptomyces misionensis TaxID=67331 RepID=A0A5C6JP51_9ACTN|nr:SDR family oxidoreductase [Streptomyces misionensis]